MCHDEKVTDELLYRYVPAADKLLCDSIPTGEEHTFSKRFERRMHALIKQERHGKIYRSITRAGKRAAVILLVSLLAGLTLTMSVEAFRDKYFRMIRSYKEGGFWEMRFFFEDEAEDDGVFLKTPGYIPEGYELTDYCHELPVWYETYEAENGSFIMIDNWQIWDGDVIGMDSEYDVEENIVIQGHDATLLVRNGDGAYYKIFWFEKNMFYQVYTTIDVPREEVIRVAESMQ